VRVAEKPVKVVSSASAPGTDADGATARPRRKGAAPKKKASAAGAARAKTSAKKKKEAKA